MKGNRVPAVELSLIEMKVVDMYNSSMNYCIHYELPAAWYNSYFSLVLPAGKYANTL
jgi:hypothetical protein